MSTEDKMTIDERWKCLRQVQPHYAKADREEKSLCWPKRTSVPVLTKVKVESLVSDGIESRERVGSAVRSRSYPLNSDG